MADRQSTHEHSDDTADEREDARHEAEPLIDGGTAAQERGDRLNPPISDVVRGRWERSEERRPDDAS